MSFPMPRGLTRPTFTFLMGIACCATALFAMEHVTFLKPDYSAFWAWPFREGRSNPGGMSYEPIALLRNILLILCGGIGALVGLHRLLQLLKLESVGATEGASAKVLSAQKRLEGELGNAMSLFQSQVENTKSHAAALERGQSNLEASQSREQVMSVIKHLVAENERMRRNNLEYQQKLEESRSQVESLRAALTESREVTARDALTNAFSRRHLDATLASFVKESKKCSTPLSFIMADLDRFKEINDKFGHPVGDDVLKSFAALMMELAKGNECVARYGGEEFAIVLPYTKLTQAVKLAEQIRQRLAAQKWAVKGGPRLGIVTASFGVSELGPGDSVSSLVEKADSKLYQSKAAGRNRVSF